MGFYGNIKNTSRTQFNFDKIYSSRSEMENSCQNDGVYAGRYVLVEYDQMVHFDAFPIGYLKDGILWASIPNTATANSIPYRLQVTPDQIAGNGDPQQGVFVAPGTIIHVPQEFNFDEDWDEVKEQVGADPNTGKPIEDMVKKPSSILYVIKPVEVEKENVQTYILKADDFSLVTNVNNKGEPVIIEKLSHASFGKLTPLTSGYAGAVQGVQYQKAYDNYVANFSIDRNRYGVGRGYDSTVWQKVYNGTSSKYVMVAELNSVVPTFDVTADAPTTTPVLPHFDADSTNVYYRLHMQPAWGFRVKAADETMKTPGLTSEGNMMAGDYIEGRIDKREYPSDQTTSWKNVTYNSITGDSSELVFITDDGNGNPSWVPALDVRENADQIDAAIYFNKAGFDPKKITYSHDKEYRDWGDTNYFVSDEISLSPTGRSGHYYNTHNGVAPLSMVPDTQELSIMLPSIGDSMAEIWDLIYGGRNLDPDAKERKLDTSWYNAKAVSNKDGVRMINAIGPGRYTYDKKAAGTVAGILNSAQDLMGMIITDEVPEQAENANDDYIYYDKNTGKYLFRHQTFEYTTQTFPNNRIPGDYSDFAPVEDAMKEWDKAWMYVDTATHSMWEYVLENTFYPERKYVRKEYVDLAMKEVHLSAEYKPDGTFFFKQRDQYPSVNGVPGASYNYFVASFAEHDPLIQYYELNPAAEQIKDNEAIYIPNTYYYITYYPVALTNVTYEPNVYYYQLVSANGGIEHHLARGATMEENTTLVNGEPKPVTQYYKRTYTLDTSLSKVEDRIYYRVLPNSGQNSNAYYKQNLKAIDMGGLTYDQYSPQNFYYIVPTREDVPAGAEFELIGTIYYVRDDATYKDEATFAATGRHYFMIEIQYELVQGEDVIEITDENAVLVQNMRDMNEFKRLDPDGNGRGIYYIYIDSEGAKRYIEVNYNNFSKAYNAIAQKYEFVIMDFTLIGEPYHANGFYYRVEDESTGKQGSYLVDDREVITPGRKYYNFEPVDGIDYAGQIIKGYFVPGRFYKEVPPGSGNFVEVEGPEELEDEEVIYDSSKTLYVFSDANNIYDQGAVWPMEVKQIPEGVVLATRTEVWELAEFEGFGDKINTLHGLLLRLHKYLNENDTFTRDLKTARGSVNMFNDLLDRFSTLAPAQFTIVDDYGRMHSAPHSTSQPIVYSNGATSLESRENALLTLTIDSNFENPSWKLIHSDANTTSDTTSTFDMNTPAEVDVIDFFTPILDNAGHVVGKNTRTVTLPYGFKKVTPMNSDAINVDVTENQTQIVATVTQDNFNIASQNKWLKLASEGKTIKIAHTLVSSSFGEQKSNAQDATPKFGDTFNIPVITVDNAGHVTEFETETVRVPGLTFTNDDGATNDVVLDMSYSYNAETDTGIFVEKRGHVDTLKIQDYNITNVASEKLANTDTIHGAFAKLQAQINAMDLTKVGGGTGEYITSVSANDGMLTVTKGELPSVTDTAVVGEFVSQVSETHGKIAVTRVAIEPTVTIGAGTADNAPTVNVTINTKSATPQALTIATTGVYGVTKLTTEYNADGTSLAVTGTSIKNALTTLTDAGKSNDAAQTIKSWKQENGKVSIETQAIMITNTNVDANAAIAISKIDGLQDALDSKQPNIPENTYDAYGSAQTISENITGTEEDSKDKLTIYGLLAYIKELEARIEEQHPTPPPTEPPETGDEEEGGEENGSGEDPNPENGSGETPDPENGSGETPDPEVTPDDSGTTT